MSKTVLGLVLGGVLGIFDGLSALVSAPETAPEIATIVIGSTFKGIIAGAAIGYFARRVNSLPLGVVFGTAVGLTLAFLVAWLNAASGKSYYWQIMLPGGVLGTIVGYATQRYRGSPQAPAAH